MFSTIGKLLDLVKGLVVSYQYGMKMRAKEKLADELKEKDDVTTARELCNTLSLLHTSSLKGKTGRGSLD